MKTIVIKQRKSIYNQQNIINCLAKMVDKSSFSIKPKGKHGYTILFNTHISNSVVEKLKKNLGLEIVYQSDVRCILTDFVNY